MKIRFPADADLNLGIVRGVLRRERFLDFMTAQAAYYLVESGERDLGLKSLRRLLSWSRVSMAPAAFLLAAHSPAWLRRSLGGVARTALKVGRSV